jgi:NAD(P)-dependent dehydrogenase (short-subunit alcohol dehydrogenase family)
MSILEGKHAVITGAASGIGAATARRFVEEGATVVLCDIDDARGGALAEELGANAAYVHVDVAEEGAIEVAIQASRDRFGGFDTIFNNAGTPGTIGSILDLPVDGFDRTLAVHLRGVFLGIRAAGRAMAAQGFGSIINTGSVAGLQANFAGHDYSAAKAGIIHLSETAANELGELGIRVNAICPGFIATAIFGRAAGLEGDQAQATVELMALSSTEAAPIKRAGLPIDIANCAVWLASDLATFVNGQRIAVDGGLTTGRLYRDSMANAPSSLGLLREAVGGA